MKRRSRFAPGARLVRRLHRPPAAEPPAVEKRAPRTGEMLERAHRHARRAADARVSSHARAPHSSADQVDVRIAAASINFRDVMVAMGTIPGLSRKRHSDRGSWGSTRPDHVAVAAGGPFRAGRRGDGDRSRRVRLVVASPRSAPDTQAGSGSTSNRRRGSRACSSPRTTH